MKFYTSYLQSEEYKYSLPTMEQFDKMGKVERITLWNKITEMAIWNSTKNETFDRNFERPINFNQEKEESVWEQLYRFIDSISEEIRENEINRKAIDFCLFKIRRRIDMLKVLF